MAGRPDFNEYEVWSPNNQGRSGAKIDAFLLHTNEGDSNADQLARWMQSPATAVSYHYTISQAADGGVTVCDVVDTDYASWSVGDANNRSINLCFAGSRAAWTRDQWLKQSKAIDVAAYLAVQDCRKYNIRPLVIPPPYADRLPGISDHNYVTKIIGWGSHTDVGGNFPWDVFAAAVAKYAGTTPAQPPQPEEPAVDALTPKQQADLYNAVMGTAAVAADNQVQLRGPGLRGWPQLGGRTLVDALAAVGQKLGLDGFEPPAVQR